MVEMRLGFETVSRAMTVNGIVKASCVLGVVMMSFQPAEAAGSPVVEAVKSLSCDQVTLPNISSYEQRFGIPAERWGSEAETALKYKIDSCYSQNMKSSSVQNEALQNKRKEMFVAQLKAGKAPQADLDQYRKTVEVVRADHANDPPKATAEENLIGTQLFVEKYCPMIQPDEDVFDSIDQSSFADKVLNPNKMTEKDRAQGANVFHFLETHTNTGYKLLSPLDLKVRCGTYATFLVGGPGFYRYVQQ